MRKLFLTGISRSIGAVGTFIFNIVLARILGIAEYGVFVVAYTLIQGASLIIRFGSSTAILKFASIMYENRELGKLLKLKKDIFTYILYFSSAVGIAVYLAKSILSHLLFDGMDVSSQLLVIALILPIFTYLPIQTSLLKAFNRPEITPFFESGFISLFTVALIYLHSREFGMSNSLDALISLGISIFITFLIARIAVNKYIKILVDGRDISLVPYEGFFSSLPSFGITHLANYLLKFSPTFLIAYYYSSDEVGLFAAANNISFIINFMLWIVSSVYAAQFATKFSAGDFDELRALVKMARLYMMVGATPFVILILIYPQFFLSLFSSDAVGAATTLRILAVAQLVNLYTGPVFYLMNMIAMEKIQMVLVVITSALSILMGLILVPDLGHIGAGIAIAFGLITQNLIAYYLSNRRLKSYING